MLQRTFHHPLDQIRRNDRDDFEPVKTKNANTLANLALLPDRGRGTFGSAGAGRGMVLRGATNIRLRWSRKGNGAAGRYKHSAPLVPRAEWSCGRYKHSAPAGAGRGMVLRGATNIRLRWSRKANEI